MFTLDHPLFLGETSAANERILHQGKILELEADIVVAEFAETLQPAPGAAITLYAEVRGKFFQHAATIFAIRQAEPAPIIAFQKVGEPVPSESRNSFRVSTAALSITAEIGKERICPIVDVSPEGFAAIMKRDYPIGTTLDCTLAFNKLDCAGPVRIQTLKKLPNGQLRYGFLAIPHRRSTIRYTLGQLTAEVQRQQLRRLSRSA